MKAWITLIENGTTRRAEVSAQASLMEALRVNGIRLPYDCGGRGTCGKCRVTIHGEAPEPNAAERALLTAAQLQNGVRLACQTEAVSGMELEVPRFGQLEAVIDGAAPEIPFAPLLEEVYVSIEDKEGIKDRTSALVQNGNRWPVRQLQDLAQLSPGDRAAVVCRSGDVLRIDPLEGTSQRPLLGAAVDIGTTTLAFYLRDLRSGRRLAAGAQENPQRAFGSDVIARIAYAQEHPDGIAELQQSVLQSINAGLSGAAADAGVCTEDIAVVVLAGNTVMLHMALGISAASIARAPFTPVFTELDWLSAPEAGLSLDDRAQVKFLPCVSGYVGADISADLLAVRALHPEPGTSLLIDIGTNGEVVLQSETEIWACSTAAGPAFEGAAISCGMPGVPGAIATMDIDGQGRPSYTVVGDEKPRGLCGSGLVDAVAALYRRGYLDETGAFHDPELPGMGTYMDMPAFAVDARRDIWLTQKDVRELQLAKGALAAGVEVLLAAAGMTHADIARVYLAGGFGQHLQAESAAAIGLIPSAWVSRVYKLGNGAGLGAQLYMLNRDCHADLEQITADIQYIELSSRPDFQMFFMEAMLLP